MEAQLPQEAFLIKASPVSQRLQGRKGPWDRGCPKGTGVPWLWKAPEHSLRSCSTPCVPQPQCPSFHGNQELQRQKLQSEPVFFHWVYEWDPVTAKPLGPVRVQGSTFTASFLKAVAGINRSPLAITDTIADAIGRCSNNPWDIPSYSKECKHFSRVVPGLKCGGQIQRLGKCSFCGCMCVRPTGKTLWKKSLWSFITFFFFLKVHCTYILGLRTHPTKSIHSYCWRDKFQWKGITVALEKLVLL